MKKNEATKKKSSPGLLKSFLLLALSMASVIQHLS
jgi:hypothetical protein